MRRAGAIGFASILVLLATPHKLVALELDGWKKSCFAANWKTGKVEEVIEKHLRPPPVAPWYAFTRQRPGGSWEIVYNYTQIQNYGLTPAAQKFVFYHECAHARLNSTRESVADCEGLRAMKKDMTVTKEMLAEITRAYLLLGRRFPSGPCIGQ